MEQTIVVKQVDQKFLVMLYLMSNTTFRFNDRIILESFALVIRNQFNEFIATPRIPNIYTIYIFRVIIPGYSPLVNITYI